MLYYCGVMRKCLVPLGSTYKDPGFFVQSSAEGNSNPATVTATLSGTQFVASLTQCDTMLLARKVHDNVS